MWGWPLQRYGQAVLSEDKVSPPTTVSPPAMEKLQVLAIGTAAPTDSAQDRGTYRLLGLEQKFKSIFPEQHQEQAAGYGILAFTQGEWLHVCYGV